MLKHLVIVLALMVSLSAQSETYVSDPLALPRLVLETQLQALQHNNTPEANAGLTTAWLYAHPENTLYPAKLEHFVAMMEDSVYSVLMNHQEHVVDLIVMQDDLAIYSVVLVPEEGPVVELQWQLELIDDAHFDTWMTTLVTPPIKSHKVI